MIITQSLQLLAWRDVALKAVEDSGCIQATMNPVKSAAHSQGASLPCSAVLNLLSAQVGTNDDNHNEVNLRGLHGNGPLVLIVARFDASERRWSSARSTATVLRQAGARVIFYSADGSIDGSLVSLIDGLALFAAADIVICAHGAAEANMLVMRPGATLIDIVPEVRYLQQAC